MNLSRYFSLVSVFAVACSFATVGCAGANDADTAADDAAEGADEAALSATAKKISGSYAGATAGRPPTFQSLRLRNDGSFEATVDTGIRCITTPCPSSSFLYGTFTAGAKTFTLKKSEWAEASDYYGRYKYTADADGNLTVTRAGSAWSGWQNELTRAESILPEDATKIVAESPGGGFVPPPPPGSTCALGAQKYSLTLATRELSWTVCDFRDGQPLQPRAGNRTISKREADKVIAATKNAAIYNGDSCGADKPFLKVKISSPSGTKTYLDSFYACQNDGTYIDGIGEIFSAMSAAAH